MPVAGLFRALGDPIRLEMVRRLSGEGPYTITTLSNGLDISRQGARKHLQILADAKLVRLQVNGRDTSVNLEREGFERSKAFIAEIESKWDARLENLRQFVER